MNKYHHPPHLFFNNTYYFITSRTYRRQRIFNNTKLKTFLLNSLKAEIQKVDYNLVAWVILDDHYHLLLNVNDATRLSNLMQQLHGGISYRLNKLCNTPGRKIFHNYWDHGIRDEADFWKHFNYIHHNPVKHGYAEDMKEYSFSSYNYWLKQKSSAWIDSCFRYYPVKDYSLQNIR